MTTAANKSVTINGGSVTTTGAQSYGGDVILGADTTFNSGSTIDFEGSLESASGTSQSVIVNGDVTFNDLGGSSGLSSLSISGDTSLSSNIAITGEQSYAGEVTLSADTMFITDSTIIFEDSVDSAPGTNQSLIVDGDVTFNGTVDVELQHKYQQRIIFRRIIPILRNIFSRWF